MLNRNHFKQLIWIRGAGELGSAVAVSLYKSGFNLFLSEIQSPKAIRRTVSFCDAVFNGESIVEGVRAFYSDNYTLLNDKKSIVPLFLDNPERILQLNPKIIIDARMLKSYKNDYRPWAEYFIGLGPGFTAGENCHAVIETKRGHSLGKIIWKGSPEVNTGIPGNIGGETSKRVVYAPISGKLSWFVRFGDYVDHDQIIGKIDSHQISASISGTIRGLIHPSIPMQKGLKIADIDPRENVNYHSISDKARSVGRAVLEAILSYS